MEAFDQSNGGGGEVYNWYTRIGERYFQIYFTEFLPNTGIDFILKVYGERLPPNDEIFGDLTEQSILLHT